MGLYRCMSNVAVQVCFFKHMPTELLSVADITAFLNNPSVGGVINEIIKYTLIVKTPFWDRIFGVDFCQRIAGLIGIFMQHGN